MCKECGTVKNRLEDTLHLSLTVKDIKGMHESLAKLVEGEDISDYECSGCKKKVDVSKRTLIAQTPNVLIVHLQRIIFNFDTFQNDKLNQHFDFPQQLDLAPYSYYEVMRRENRLSQQQEKEGEGAGESQKEEEGKDAMADKEEPEAGKGAADDAAKKEEPEEVPPALEELMDDCFEYKLVGVTVHSGSAHAGHYWSYINTHRGGEEAGAGGEGDAWAQTDDDRWMEFNDSTVRDF